MSTESNTCPDHYEGLSVPYVHGVQKLTEGSALLPGQIIKVLWDSEHEIEVEHVNAERRHFYLSKWCG